MDVKELYWAAGIIEGEGCFSIANGTALVDVHQNEAEILHRLVKLFGGKVMPDQKTFRWRVYGARARGVMMTLYSLMSTRRKARITQVLLHWKLGLGAAIGPRMLSHLTQQKG